MRWPFQVCPLHRGAQLQDYGLINYHPAMGQTQQTQQTANSGEIDVKVLQDMYRKFVMECPSGLLFLHEFKRFFGVDATGEASEYAENMFRAFDKNGVRVKAVTARHSVHLYLFNVQM